MYPELSIGAGVLKGGSGDQLLQRGAYQDTDDMKGEIQNGGTLIRRKKEGQYLKEE